MVHSLLDLFYKYFFHTPFLLLLSPFLKSSVFPTTETEENAIAAPANIGFNKYPLKGYSNPIATGIPTTL